MKTNKWLVSVTVMLPTLMVIIDSSVVNVSLDHIRGSLSAGIDEATWSITSYLAANAVVIPMTGWLSRFFGRRRYLIFSVALFTLSSLLCGFAWNIQSLVVFRIIQGISGGSLQPISQSILLETFPPVQHGTAMAIFGAGVMVGPVVGPLLGGWITDNWSWHWIFFVNVPVGIISIFMSFFFIVDPHYMRAKRVPVDYWGLGLLAVGIGALQMALDRGQREDWFGSNFIFYLVVIAAFALILFLIVELYFAEHPIVHLRVFRSPSFTLGNIIMIIFFMNLFGSVVLLPLYLQTLLGYTATLAGIVLGPGAMATMVIMPVAGRLVNVINSKFILAVGLVLTAASTYSMALFNLAVDFNTVLGVRILQGISMGFVFIPLITLSLSGVPKEEMANATSVFNSLRTLGGSFGVAFIATMLSRRAQYHQHHLVDNLTPFDTSYQMGAHAASNYLQLQGMDPVSAGRVGPGLIYGKLIREAAMLSYNDVFFLLSIILITVLPLVFFMKRIKHS